MDMLRHIFLENPLGLWIVLGVAEILALVAWRRTRSRRATAAAIALPAAALLVGFLAWAVETDYERLMRTVETMARAADSGDSEAFVERISPDYANRGARREDLAAVVRIGLACVRASANQPTLRWENGRAVVQQTWDFRPTPGRPIVIEGQQRVRVLWEGVFAPDSDGEWRLRSAMALKPKRITPEEAARYLPR
ncbi:MAG TPA: hypothetical protein VMY35_06270 [Phycisphaerae bacterium]|nr:hypothetical protein [Phycisphaerae bacterium]